jgi:Cof subfamily protein (haloacid dehalogenase superfamily)
VEKFIEASKIKALALDLDGTALLPDTSLGERTARCLKRLISRGIQVIFCTGRAIESSCRYYNAIGAEGPMVFFNGAEVANVPDVKLISSNLLSLDVVDYGIDLARDLGIHFQMYLPPRKTAVAGESGWEALVVQKQCFESEMYRRHTGITPVVADLKTAVSGVEGCIKIMFIADSRFLEGVSRRMAGRFGGDIYIARSFPTFLDIMNAGVSKGEGLKTAMACRGLKPEEVIAFGDEENDLPMFTVAGFSAAPSSANEKVRKAADFEFGPNAEEGLAAFLEEMFQ